MKLSEHSVLSKIKDSTDYYILNSLTGNADILTEAEARTIFQGKYNELPELEEKGYVIKDEKEENRRYRQRYLDFLDQREKEEIQLFFVPTYACNFNCSYCYQSGYGITPGKVDSQLIDAFFTHVDNKFAGKKKYITLFGGEPLLPGKKYQEGIEYFVEQCNKYNLDLAVVTNGYYLEEYLEILRKANIREIQVTLDGTAGTHNKRRSTKNGEGSFDKIVNGIDKMLDQKIPLNLRVVIDRDNVDNLVDLAHFAINKGWTRNDLVKTQLGRNYELHFCQQANSSLMSRIEMFETLYGILKKHPRILEFHKPAFSVSKFLFENNSLPGPLFDACPGCKTEWAYDYTGHIYSCTATVGKKDEVLGSFFPVEQLNEERVEEWEERDILTINECKKCNIRLLCGGGCGAIAKNNSGKLHAPDCRPSKELISLGIACYFNNKL